MSIFAEVRQALNEYGDAWLTFRRCTVCEAADVRASSNEASDPVCSRVHRIVEWDETYSYVHVTLLSEEGAGVVEMVYPNGERHHVDLSYFNDVNAEWSWMLRSLRPAMPAFRKVA